MRYSSLMSAAALALVSTVAVAAPAEVTLRVTVPSTTPAGAGVYIAGDFQGWRPGDPGHRLVKTDDGTWTIVLNLETGSAIQFKFTLGDWSRVEKGAAGQEIQNRLLRVVGDCTVELAVASWADGRPPQPSKTGRIDEITVPGFLDGRTVWVYLPPGYDRDGERRFPVLYMMDGQNVFDDSTSFAGEWKVDETLERMIPAGEVAPLIVVAVANGGAARTHEYTPWPGTGARTGGGGGREHLEAWIETLMPAIDQRYRTLTGPAHTGLAGSSLGGLMALFAAYDRPEVFGRIAAFSPSLWWAGGHLAAWMTERQRPAVTVYMDMGTREEGNLRDGDANGVDDFIDALRATKDIMIGQGFAGGLDLLVVEDEGARHHESFWAARFPGAVRFLFPEARE